MRWQPKFSLRLLILAAAIVPIAVWGVYQYRAYRDRLAARDRLQQLEIETPGFSEPVRSRLSFQKDSSLVELFFDRRHAPEKLLADCRQAGARVRAIRLSDECLVDLGLARQIATSSQLERLIIEPQAQIEPAAIPILLGTAPEVVLPADFLQVVLSQDPLPPPPKHLVVNYLSNDREEFLGTVRAAIDWGPQSLLLSYHLNPRQRESLLSDGAPLRTKFNQLQLANPHMLIALSALWGADGGTAPIYQWKNPELKERFEKTFSNDLTDEERETLWAQIREQEPAAWPILQGDVMADFFAGDFGPAAEARAKKLIELAPWSPEGHFNAGLAHYLRGEYSLAMDPLKQGILRGDLGFGDEFQMSFGANRGTLFLAAAHVAAGRRAEGLQLLERRLVGHRENEDFAAFVISGVWIQCTDPQANAATAANCAQQLTFAEIILAQRGLTAEFEDQLHWTRAALACVQRDFARAQAEYEPVAKRLSPAVKPRFRAEFTRLGESIQQRRPFVTNYVPVVPIWD